MSDPGSYFALESDFLPDSQYPSTAFILKGSTKDAQSVRLQVFATNLARTANSIGLDFYLAGKPQIHQDLPDDIELQRLADNGQLMRVDFTLYDHSRPPRGNSTNLGDPVWSMDARDRRLARNKAPNLLTHQEKMANAFDKARRFTLYRQTSGPGDVDQLTKFAEYMRSCSYAAANLGNF